MSFSEELLKILACPVCKAELLPDSEKQLICQQCGRRYPVKEDGIVVFLISESDRH